MDGSPDYILRTFAEIRNLRDTWNLEKPADYAYWLEQALGPQRLSTKFDNVLFLRAFDRVFAHGMRFLRNCWVPGTPAPDAEACLNTCVTLCN